MKVLITGGAGFIGSHLSDRLIDTGHHVTAVDDLSTGRLDNIAHLERSGAFQFVQESIMHEGVMDRLVSECDVIYHLASAVGVELIVSRPVEVIERCVLGTEIVLQAPPIATGRRCSSPAPRRSTARTPASRSRKTTTGCSAPPPRAAGATRARRRSTSSWRSRISKERQLPIVIVRLFNTVGPRQTGPLRHGGAALHPAGARRQAADRLRRRPPAALLRLRRRHRRRAGRR